MAMDAGGGEGRPGSAGAGGGCLLRLFAAQLAWLVCSAASVRWIGPEGARAAAFAGGALCLILAGALPPPRLRDLAVFAVAAAGGLAVVPALAAGIARLFPVPALEARAPGHGGAVHLVAVAVLAPLCEERLFRGLLLDWLRPHLGAAASVLTAAAGFGLWHGLGALAAVAALLGLLLGVLRIASGGLAVPTGTHAGLNLALLVAGLPPDAHPLAPGASALAGTALLGGVVWLARGQANARG